MAILAFICLTANAQRKTDALDRGLVVIPTGPTSGSTTNLLTWRRLADEYFDVTYNVYKNGTLAVSNLSGTNYSISGGSSDAYQIAPVVKGGEQQKCDSVFAWQQYVYNLNVRCATGYIDLQLAAVKDRNGNDVSTNYEPNDAEFADLDGDGQLEMIIKRLNTYDAGNLYPQNSTQFVVIDAYDINWETGADSLMWRIDCGPNMISLNSTEIDIIAYDWDEDGKAEVVLRGADNMIVYDKKGKRLFTVGDMSVNSRASSYPSAQYAWTHTGAEYLIYMNGETGAKYSVVEYPLKRLESGETSEKTAWGDDYGHRSTKHFFGAPCFDGRHASLFLARGIYTRTKMIAMDLNSDHTWSTRWTWSNNQSGSIWYGQGNHNYVVADVDWDGRDEIVYGSMCIDDNGKGMSSTGLGHGDAMHVGDHNPYIHGSEVFACNEDNPGNNYRNATTSEIYYRNSAGDDDGRALMANFSDDYPGSLGRSVSSGMINSVSSSVVDGLGGDTYIAWGDLNFRIYWDGDLCSEILNSPGTAREAKVEKPGTGRIFTSYGCNMNNDSKNNPCFQGDLIGDWREEIVVRCGSNVRIYTTGMGTDYSMPSLWFDHQYRQAMVWQMMAYNQPPHLSFFLGELEGFNVAPPPYTMQNRTEIGNGGTISSAYNGQQLIMAATGDMSVSVNNGAAPWVLIDNAPTWVQGNHGGAITTSTYTHTLTGGALTGGMHLVKQGDGTLKMSTANHTYTGRTEIWAGTVEFDGTLASSPVWMNRFTTLKSEGGQFLGGIESLYASTIIPGGDNKRGDITTTTLTLNYGARLKIDVFGNSIQADHVNMESLVLNTKSGGNWETFGPQYLKPVIEFVPQGTLADGMYLLGQLTNEADFSNVIIEGLNGYTYEIVQRSGNWYLKIGTGVAVECAEPVIARTSWNETDLNVYYPTVSITATPFTYKGNTVTPTLSAVFTALDGTETPIDNIIYTENYEKATSVSWTTPGANIVLGTGDATYGNYFFVNTGQVNTRYAYTDLSDVADVSDVENYAIEFDLAMKSGNTDGMEFCVMAKNGVNPSANWDNYAAINSNANMLFDVTAPKNSTTFAVNGTTTTTTLNTDTWYHYTLNVNKTAGTVDWAISNGSSGSFNYSGSGDFRGFYLVAGRYQSMLKLDNIQIYKTSTTTSLYAQNYENASDASSWTGQYVTRSLVTDDATYGNYISLVQGGGSGPRTAYTRLYNTGNDFYGDATVYSIDFDANIHYSVGGSSSSDNILVLYGEGASMPASNANWSGTNFLFKLTGGKNYSTAYSIEDNSVSVTVPDKTWCHYKITIDKNTGRLSYLITSGSGEVGRGSYSISGKTSQNIQGLCMTLGRMNSSAFIDNISITTTKDATDLSSYTFTEPGTLTVTASYDGCMPTSTSYTSEIGAKVGSLGYSTLNFQLASLDFSKSGIELYKVKADNGLKSVTTTKVDDCILPQGTAALLKGTAGEIYASDIVSSAADWSGNDLIPTTGTVYGNGSIYVLNTGSSGVGFYRLLDDGTVTIGRGYLNLQGSSVKVLPFEDDDTPTGITVIEAADIAKTVIYDLSGRRVSKPSRGVYIVNGKKVLIK